MLYGSGTDVSLELVLSNVNSERIFMIRGETQDFLVIFVMGRLKGKF